VYVAVIRDVGLSGQGAAYCLDRHTGRVLWQFDDDGGMLPAFATPCLADGRLYLGEGMHSHSRCKLYCLDAVSGRKQWHFQTTSHLESSPCIVAGSVFFGAGDEGMFCLDAVTGAVRWHFAEPLHIDASPLVVGKRLYAGSGFSRAFARREIFCLDSQNGKALWRKDVDLGAWGAPSASGDQVFFGLANGKLMEDVKPPAQAAGAVLCVEAQTGRRVWRCDVDGGVFVRPMVAGELLYFAARDGFCYCLERATGALRWKESVGSPVVAGPALVDERVYVAASAGRISCLSAASGSVVWTFDVALVSGTKPELTSAPVVVPDPQSDGDHRLIYFGSELHNAVSSAAVLYCLRD
jgi:outer membrane protein assembly factor BamB